MYNKVRGVSIRTADAGSGSNGDGLTGVITGSSAYQQEGNVIFLSNDGNSRWAVPSPQANRNKIYGSVNLTRGPIAGKVPKTAGRVNDGVFTSIPSGMGSRISSPADTLFAMGARTGAGFNLRGARVKNSLNMNQR